jgi:hypothetical protein
MKQCINPAHGTLGKRRTAWSVSSLKGGRFGFLMLAILLMILIRPFLEGLPGIELLTDLFFIGIFLSGIYAARGDKYRYRLALLFAGVGLAARIAHRVHGGPVLEFLSEGWGALFFVQALVNIAAHIRAEREVTLDLIFAAVCAYLLLGLVWAYAYYFLETVHPGSFKAAEPLDGDLWAFFYYSFVTLTSLGYGDIVAATRPARSLTIVEVIVGQLYLAGDFDRTAGGGVCGAVAGGR